MRRRMVNVGEAEGRGNIQRNVLTRLVHRMFGPANVQPSTEHTSVPEAHDPHASRER